MSAIDISLILPAYNEERTIRAAIEEAGDYFRKRMLRYEIIVSADGEDRTREIARELGKNDPAITVMGENARRGKGRGIREGVAAATGAIIGFADADNKVRITEYGKLEPWLRQGYDVVIGSRGKEHSVVERRQPLHRRIGSLGFYFFMQAVVGLPGIRDTQCGFKFFRRDVARDLFARQMIDGYMYDVEILLLARRLGYTVKEVGICWCDDADSRLQLFSGNLRNVIDIFKIRLSQRQVKRYAPAVKTTAQ